MKNISGSLLSNFWITLALSLLMALAAGLIAHHWLKINSVGSAGLVFGMSTKILELLKDNLNKRLLSKEKLDILKRFAREKIEQTRVILHRKDVGPIISHLASLEFIVTEIAKCCEERKQIEDFNKIKGLIAGSKKIFNLSKFDQTMQKPYEDVIKSINNIESYLNDL